MAVKTTRITVETETLMIVRRAKAALAWCPDCRVEVEAISVESDGFIQIHEWLGTGKLHLWQLANAPAQICVPSLLQCFESEQVQRLFRSHMNLLDELRRKQK